MSKHPNFYIYHLLALFTPILAWYWFGWKAFVVVFLIVWICNTEKYSDE